ncbi:MAG: hypothetical protein IT167_02220 [Bryobacterales bacterium]|nr:hypothetical protein [Bryobacterales bacterium]
MPSGLIMWVVGTAGLLSAQLPAPPQPPRVVMLDVLVENLVSYRLDVADPLTFAAARGPVASPVVRTFQEVIGVGDIISVNGKPAKGVWTNYGHTLNLSPAPAPGEPIADVASSTGHIECSWVFYTTDGVFVGSLNDRGVGMHSMTGGGGAFLGAHGEHRNGPRGPGGFDPPIRRASVTEDPSMRRVNGGGTWQALVYLTPAFWPEIDSTPQGSAIFHADFSQVTPARPAEPGEMLIIRAKGLGPTLPDLRPAGLVRFGNGPYDQVSSPVEVSVGGKTTEVLNKIGWPGETDVYRVDFRMPSGIPPGIVALQITAAWIPGPAASIAVR